MMKKIYKEDDKLNNEFISISFINYLLILFYKI